MQFSIFCLLKIFLQFYFFIERVDVKDTVTCFVNHKYQANLNLNYTQTICVCPKEIAFHISVINSINGLIPRRVVFRGVCVCAFSDCWSLMDKFLYQKFVSNCRWFLTEAVRLKGLLNASA